MIKSIRYKLAVLIFGLLIYLICPISLKIAKAQVPIGLVVDAPLQIENTIILTSELLMQFLLKKEEGFAGIIKDVNEFFKKADTVVNGAIKNMRMIRSIVDMYQEIINLYDSTLENLNDPLTAAGSLVELEGDVINKWKHLQILLGITKRASTIVDLFAKIIEDDSLTMDDKGRVKMIHTIYEEIRLIRSSMRLEVRRINKDIYKYRKTKKEIQTYGELFGIQ